MTFLVARGFLNTTSTTSMRNQSRVVIDEGSSSDDGGGGTSDENNIIPSPYVTTLCNNPKTLNVLWSECEFGVGGRKAAKLFSAAQERGRVKFQYSLRKGFWDLYSGMIRRGYTSDTAIILDKIYEVYSSRMSCTEILQLIRRDKKNGGHPRLHS